MALPGGGCRGGAIAAWLCRRVGPTGRDLATDPDPRSLDALAARDAPNLEVRRHDVTTDALPDGAFELVHTRGVLEHLPAPARAAARGRLAAALAPGGWLLAEAPDYVSWAPATGCPAARAARFAAASAAVLRALPGDAFYGRHLAGELQAQGLAEVAAEGRVALVRGASPAARSWGTAWAALGERIVASGALTRPELAGFVALHDDPDFAWLGPVAVAAWGRRPLGPAGPAAGAVQEDGRPGAAGAETAPGRPPPGVRTTSGCLARRSGGRPSRAGTIRTCCLHATKPARERREGRPIGRRAPLLGLRALLVEEVGRPGVDA